MCLKLPTFQTRRITANAVIVFTLKVILEPPLRIVEHRANYIAATLAYAALLSEENSNALRRLAST